MSDADGRERQLEAENSALRAQLAAAGLTTGRGSGLDRFALDQSAPPDNPFLRPRDYPSSRFAALLPQLGYAGEGQPGLLLEHPLPTDPAYDAARRASDKTTKFKGQIYRHIFSAAAYLTLSGDVAYSYDERLRGELDTLDILQDLATQLPDPPADPPAPVNPGEGASADQQATYAAALEEYNTAVETHRVHRQATDGLRTGVASVKDALSEFRTLHQAAFNTSSRSLEILTRAVTVLFSDLAPAAALPQGAAEYIKDQLRPTSEYVSLDPALASVVDAYQGSVDRFTAKEAARSAAGGSSGTGGGGGSSHDRVDKLIGKVEALSKAVARLQQSGKGKTSDARKGDGADKS